MLSRLRHVQQTSDGPKPQALLNQARQELAQGEIEAALSRAYSALQKYHQTSNRQGQRQAETLVGDILLAAGQASHAIEHYQRVTVTEVPAERACAWLKLAEVYQAEGHLDAAVDAYHRAIPLLARLGQINLQVQAIYQMAYLRYEQANWQDAERLYQKALRLITQATLDPPMESRILLELGNTLAQQGRLTAAAGLFALSIESARSTGDYPVLASALHGLGVTLAHEGRPGEALAPLQYSLALQSTMADWQTRACTLYELGMNWARLGRPDLAEALLRKAISLYEENDAPEGQWTRAALVRYLAEFAPPGSGDN